MGLACPRARPRLDRATRPRGLGERLLEVLDDDVAHGLDADREADNVGPVPAVIRFPSLSWRWVVELGIWVS